jgi:hypothetical protein
MPRIPNHEKFERFGCDSRRMRRSGSRHQQVRPGRFAMKTLLSIAAIAIFATSSAAQTTPCGNRTGITIDVTSSGDSINRAQSISMSTAVDTTWVFNVARKTWNFGHIDAAIKADWVGANQNSRVCSGVTASMEDARLSVTGARGTIHFKASLADLSSLR